MNRVPDRVKMRREYLEDKTAAAAQRIAGIVLTVFCTLAAFVYGISALLQIVVWTLVRNLYMPTETMITRLVLLLLFSLGAFLGLHIFRTAEWEKSISYVPPVREQLPTLPAEEVLLRGSQTSPAAPEQLLRAAGSEQTPAEELLRAAPDGYPSGG